jgi:hypothetical protein
MDKGNRSISIGGNGGKKSKKFEKFERFEKLHNEAGHADAYSEK